MKTGHAFKDPNQKESLSKKSFQYYQNKNRARQMYQLKNAIQVEPIKVSQQFLEQKIIGAKSIKLYKPK